LNTERKTRFRKTRGNQEFFPGRNSKGEGQAILFGTIIARGQGTEDCIGRLVGGVWKEG
jgi:hypothetical protein